MSSTCFEPEGSSSGRRLYVQVWYNLLTCIGISSLVGGRVCSLFSIILAKVHLVGLYYKIANYSICNFNQTAALTFNDVSSVFALV